MEESIQKSRLYREAYLPGAANRLRNKSYVEVVGCRNNESESDKIDKTQLMEVVLHKLLEWEDLPGGVVDPAFLQAAQNQLLQVQSPSQVYVSAWPIILRCEKCKTMDFYHGRDDERTKKAVISRLVERGGRSYLKCKHCTGFLVQVPFLAVHRCGHKQSLFIAYNSRDRVEKLGFDSSSGSFFNSYFYDVDTNEHTDHALQGNCRHCEKTEQDKNNLNMRGTSITGGDSFYSQTLQFISLTRKTGEFLKDVMNSTRNLEGVLNTQGHDIAVGLGACVTGVIAPKRFSNGVDKILCGSEEVDTTKLQEELDELRSSLGQLESIAQGNPSLAPAVEASKKRIEALETQISESSGVFSNIGSLVQHRSTLAALAKTRRTLEAIFLKEDFNSRSVSGVIKDEAGGTYGKELENQWVAIQENYGIADISHLDDINVVMSAYGYTRERRGHVEDPEAVPTRLMGFVDKVDPQLDGKKMIYAMSAKTEGLYIQLDATRVLQWCIDALGWDKPSEEILTNQTKAKAYLLDNCPALTMDPFEVLQETKDMPIKETGPFHLLHTISHCLLASIKRHTGYEDKSVMEYLFPMDLSFVLYVTSVQNYTAGGCLTLFRHYQKAWFDDACNYAFNCIFDPVCADKGSSCSGCVQIVIGCETFNHGLSRSFIHGGRLESEEMIKEGFWSN